MSNPVQGSVSQSRNPLPISDIYVNGDPLAEAIVRKVTVNEEVNKHHSAIISLTYANANLEELKNQPVFFRYGSNPRFGYFWGYVKEASKEQGFQKEIRISLVCYGYTWNMRTPNSRMWINTSLADIATDVAFKHRMGVFFPDHWYSPKRFAQSESTDWQTLVELAALSDRVVVARRGVIRFVDITDELERRQAVNSYEKSLNTLDPQEKGLLEFNASSSVNTDVDDLSQRVGFFTSSNEVSVMEDSDRDESEQVNNTSVYINNEDDARIVREMSSSPDADYAEARLRGDAQVTAACVVDISTGSGRAIRDSLDGLWFVGAVTHSIDEGTFQTNCQLVRDQYRSSTGERYDFYNGVRRAQPDLRLSNGKWVSSWA